MDRELTQPRSRPHSVKVCLEKIDEHREWCESLLQTCKEENREFNATEKARWDDITANLVPAWKTELAHARHFEQRILQEAKHGSAREV